MSKFTYVSGSPQQRNHLSEAVLQAATKTELVERTAQGARLHCIGTLATGVGMVGIVASLDGGVGDWQRLLPWLGLVVLAVVALRHVLVRNRHMPAARQTVDPTFITVAASGLVVGSVGWFDLDGFAHESYAFAACAATLAFCAGTLIALNPLSRLIAATVVPAIVSLSLSMLVTGNPVPALCALLVLAIILRPLPDLHRNVDELVRARVIAHHASTHDPLCGVLNRAGLSEVVRPGAAVIYGDLDDFKTINDQYGHGVGDDVLRTLADRFAGVADRHRAHVARVGGDEFVIVVTSRRKADADAVATGLMLLGGKPIEPVGNLGLSFGIARVGEDGDLASALSNADHALYQAKRTTGTDAVWFTPCDSAVVADLRTPVETPPLLADVSPANVVIPAS